MKKLFNKNKKYEDAMEVIIAYKEKYLKENFNSTTNISDKYIK